MRLRRSVRFSLREDAAWNEIGMWFGLGIAEALRWFLSGAPITLLPTDGGQYRIPYADREELAEWLKDRFKMPKFKRREFIESWLERCRKHRAEWVAADAAAKAREAEESQEEDGLECELEAEEDPPCAEDRLPVQDRAPARI